MSDKKLKFSSYKEYKRKSKHTRNPSYYPRHLTKVRLSDLDGEYNLPTYKEAAAVRGHGKKVVSKSGGLMYTNHYGYIKSARIERFISKFIGKPYNDLCKAYDSWLAPIKEKLAWNQYPLSDYFKESRWRRRDRLFYIDEEGLVRAKLLPSHKPAVINKKLWKENMTRKIPDFGSVSMPVKITSNSYSDTSRTSNGTDPNYYKPRPLGKYWCLVNGKPVRLPVYHVHNAMAYIDWVSNGKAQYHWGKVTKTDTFCQLYRQGTYSYNEAKKLEDEWVFVTIPCSRYGNLHETLQHFRHNYVEEVENTAIGGIDIQIATWQGIIDTIASGKPVYYNSGMEVSMEVAERRLLECKREKERAPRFISMDSGYGQLCPLVKRCDYERVFKETAN